MDLRERWADNEEEHRTALEGRQAAIWTALPCKVVSYDADKQTCVLKSSIKSIERQPDGTTKQVELPEFQDVPVQFASGGKTVMTWPIQKDDECIVIFSSRAIDGWHQNGDVQGPTDARMHDLSDGMMIPGIRSQPRKLKKVSKDSVQMRSEDGEHVVDLHPEKGITHTSKTAVNIKAPAGTFEMKKLTVKGTVEVQQHPEGGGGVVKAAKAIGAPILSGAPGSIPPE